LGAGDVFHGGLIAGLYRGLGLVEAVRFANAAAALSCRAIDGQSGVPGLAEVEALITANTYD
jgi:sugar/nucleoside kinase (ribokinase family)